MKPNYKCNKTGELLTILNVRTKIINGERKYFDKKWNPLDVTKLGSMQDLGIRTDEGINRI